MSQDISPEVLQRELVEATQQLTIAEADLTRRQTEARNAEANRDAAQAKVDAIQAQYDGARGVTREAAPAKPAPVASSTVDEPPSL